MALKERRRVVLMLCETPLHLGHIRSMAAVTEAGAAIYPPAPAHRALRSAIEAAQAFEGETVGAVLGLDGKEIPVPRFGTRVADHTANGEVAAMSLYAGESVGSVKRVRPAGDIVRELADEAERLLRN